MPAAGQLRRVTLEEAAQELGRIGRIVGRAVAAGIVGPAPRILVVVDIVPQPGESDDVLQVVPGDAADWVLSDHTGDDDPQLRHRAPLVRWRCAWLSGRAACLGRLSEAFDRSRLRA